MDIATIIGFFGGVGCIILGCVSGGTPLGSVMDLASIIIVLGGSYASLFIGYPLKTCIGIFSIIGRTLKVPDFGEKALVQNMVSLAEKARREGILALEEGLDDLDDEFMKSGLRLVVDGTDGAVIRNIMESEMVQIEDRHMGWINVVVSWAGLAPGYGMLGTVIGLIGMLQNLEDKASLGPNMATALITTLYGSLVANWLMTPISQKLASHNALEMRTKEMIIEGVLSIQAGDNPRILAMKLLTYLDPKSRKVIEAEVLRD